MGRRNYTPPCVPTDVIMVNNIVKNNLHGIKIEAGNTLVESNNYVANNTSRNYFKTINPSFEIGTGSFIQEPMGWSETGDVLASYATNQAGAFSGAYQLRFWSSNPFNVTTYQTFNVPNGTYSLRARVRNTVGGQNSAVMIATNFGGTDKSVSIANTVSAWTLYQITGINVTNGYCTIGFSVNSPSGISLEVDHVEFYMP